MSNYIDYKATIWFRIPIESDEALKKVKEKLETGSLPVHVYDELLMEDLGQCETLYDTEEFINPNENDGQATIEIYSDDKMIWDNSYESEIKRKEECKNK